MKKLLVSVVLLAIISSVVCAGDNQSTKYVRLLSRNAATDSIDSVYFNPAGTAFLQKGFHIQLNGQAVRLDYSHELSSKTHTMINWVPFIPSAYAGYSGGNWAVFAGYSIPQGGGSLKWNSIKFFYKAASRFLDGDFEGESSTHMLSVGASHTLSPIIAIGARFDTSFATADYEADFTFPTALGGAAVSGMAKMSKSGMGFGGTLGIHVQPNEKINASLTVESTKEIKLKEESSGGARGTLGILKASAPDEATTPWVIRAGFSYTFPFELEIPVSFKYSFWKAVDDDKKDTMDAAVGFRYWLSEQLELSLGGSYTTSDTPKKKMDNTFLDPELSSITIGGGMGWEIFDNLNLDLGLLYPIYFEKDGKLYKELNKQVVVMSLGIGYIF